MLRTFRLSLCVLIVIGTASFSHIRAGLRDNNLIEFSRGSYAWRTRTALLWPPTVKIYQDATISLIRFLELRVDPLSLRAGQGCSRRVMQLPVRRLRRLQMSMHLFGPDQTTATTSP